MGAVLVVEVIEVVEREGDGAVATAIPPTPTGEEGESSVGRGDSGCDLLLSVVCKTGELEVEVVDSTEVVTEVIFEVLLPVETSGGPLDNWVAVRFGSSLELAGSLVLSVVFETGELVTGVVDSTEVVTEVMC